jgi:hypothetical protein
MAYLIFILFILQLKINRHRFKKLILKLQKFNYSFISA